MTDLTDHYCNPEDGAILRGRPGDVGLIQAWWQDSIDRLMEVHTGQGYKGRRRTYTTSGTGNTLIRLPSVAASVESIYEQGRLLRQREYELEDNGQLIDRSFNRASLMWIQPRPTWLDRVKYVVTYLEPTIDQLPDEWRLCAANCLGQVLMFQKQYKEFDMSLTRTDSASAGKVATSASTSLPDSLIDTLRKTISAALKKRQI